MYFLPYIIWGIVIFILAGLIAFGIAYTARDKVSKLTWLVSGIVSVVSVLIYSISLLVYFHTASGERSLTTAKSNYTGGLIRLVKVYDYNGHLLKTYKGRFDIQENDAGTKVLFDLNGKRHIIYNGIVVVDQIKE